MNNIAKLMTENRRVLNKAGIKFAAGIRTAERKGWERIAPEADGFLTSFPAFMGVEFLLALRIPRSLNIKPARVKVYEGGRFLKTLPDQSEEKNAGLFSRIIVNTATRKSTSDGYVALSTKHNNNNIRLVAAIKNVFQMWELAIVTRVGADDEAGFFLTVQKLYQGKMYNRAGRIYIPDWEYPGFQRWPSLQRFLAQMVNARQLPPADQILTVPSDKTEKIEKHEAVVEFFCLASGLGLARIVKGHKAVIHWRDIITDDRFAGLAAGQKLFFDGLEIHGQTKRYLQLKEIYPA